MFPIGAHIPAVVYGVEIFVENDLVVAPYGNLMRLGLIVGGIMQPYIKSVVGNGIASAPISSALPRHGCFIQLDKGSRIRCLKGDSERCDGQKCKQQYFPHGAPSPS